MNLINYSHMTFEEYQDKAMQTSMEYGAQAYNYGGLGLASEAGEVAGKLKRVIRDDHNQVTEEMRADLKKELGDVLWYVNFLTTQLGYTLEEVAEANIEKLHSRKDRGVLTGQGDNR